MLLSLQMSVTKCLWTASLGLFLGLLYGPVFSSASFPITRAKPNDPADLYCNISCPGVTQWRRNDEEVAECGPGAKTGFKFTCTVNKGQSILTIPQVNHSTRGFYLTYCDGEEMFDSQQLLHLLPLESDLELDAGERLELDLQISQPVIIMVTRPDTPSTVQLCSVDGRQYQCLPEYQPRVLIIRNTFILMEMMPSDSGNYTVQEKDNTRVSISHVTVKAVQDSWVWKSAWKSAYEKGNSDGYQKGNSDGYQMGVGIGALAVGSAALVILIVVFVLGVFAAPRVRPPMDSCVQMLRSKDSSYRNQSEDEERGPSLASNGDIQS
ncbi:uncharacterized protein LOC118826975 isoform X3 [Colossoma macropomum]|uniref:uncharacterized protein LOC118826975 isoform X3 n=1 Tax=Colossoma macropomum TaxID=42526 RepID=UPI001863BCA0|nr:uncharacterized protein LOC118826975 isoform X3 [Colossoma macropomum]